MFTGKWLDSLGGSMNSISGLCAFSNNNSSKVGPSKTSRSSSITTTASSSNEDVTFDLPEIISKMEVSIITIARLHKIETYPIDILVEMILTMLISKSSCIGLTKEGNFTIHGKIRKSNPENILPYNIILEISPEKQIFDEASDSNHRIFSECEPFLKLFDSFTALVQTLVDPALWPAVVNKDNLVYNFGPREEINKSTIKLVTSEKLNLTQVNFHFDNELNRTVILPDSIDAGESVHASGVPHVSAPHVSAPLPVTDIPIPILPYLMSSSVPEGYKLHAKLGGPQLEAQFSLKHELSSWQRTSGGTTLIITAPKNSMLALEPETEYFVLKFPLHEGWLEEGLNFDKPEFLTPEPCGITGLNICPIEVGPEPDRCAKFTRHSKSDECSVWTTNSCMHLCPLHALTELKLGREDLMDIDNTTNTNIVPLTIISDYPDEINFSSNRNDETYPLLYSKKGKGKDDLAFDFDFSTKVTSHLAKISNEEEDEDEYDYLPETNFPTATSFRKLRDFGAPIYSSKKGKEEASYLAEESAESPEEPVLKAQPPVFKFNDLTEIFKTKTQIPVEVNNFSFIKDRINELTASTLELPDSLPKLVILLPKLLNLPENRLDYSLNLDTGNLIPPKSAKLFHYKVGKIVSNYHDTSIEVLTFLLDLYDNNLAELLSGLGLISS